MRFWEDLLPRVIRETAFIGIPGVIDLFSVVTDTLTRLQSQSANPWVKIEDIPEAWKDGRDLDVTHKTLGRITDCEGDVIADLLEGITHAMLPIAPPKTEE